MRPPIFLRLSLAPDIPFGPGKAALLEGIRDLGSIAAAGRRMGMSYQRAWTLVSAMNAQFREPLVMAVKGGAKGGGATLTPLGEAVLAEYRAAEAAAAAAVAPAMARLRSWLAVPAS